MNPAAPFIARPVATTLLTIAVALAGIGAFQLLPVAPLPQVDFPTIAVSAQLPGASPETMASSVATPLERQFGRIAGVTEMTSSSSLGTTNVILQFDLDRNIDAAARDVQAAIAAARQLLRRALERRRVDTGGLEPGPGTDAHELSVHTRLDARSGARDEVARRAHGLPRA